MTEWQYWILAYYFVSLILTWIGLGYESAKKEEAEYDMFLSAIVLCWIALPMALCCCSGKMLYKLTRATEGKPDDK